MTMTSGPKLSTDECIVCLGFRTGYKDAARKLGVRVVFVVDKLKGLIGDEEIIEVSSISDPEAVVSAVDSRISSNDIVGAVTGHEQAVFSLAVLRSAYDLPAAIPLQIVSRFRDKGVQKRVLPASINRARINRLEGEESYSDIVASLGIPFVLKPASGTGSKNTYVISTASEFESIRQSLPSEKNGSVVEQFVDGLEWHFDGVYVDGKIVWCTLSRYLFPLVQAENWGGMVDLPWQPGKHIEAQIEKLAHSALHELSAPDCIFHLEGFLGQKGEIVFGEIAIRLAGGRIPEMIYHNESVDLYLSDILIALGSAPTDLVNLVGEGHQLMGYMFLSRERGERFLEYLNNYPSAISGTIDVEVPQDKAVSVRGSYGRWATVYFYGSDFGVLEKTMNEVLAIMEG